MNNVSTTSKDNRNVLVGRLVNAGPKYGRISSISMPDITEGITVLTAKELGTANRIVFHGISIPILADDTIEYPFQPVLAVFAPKIETVMIFIAGIEIKTFPSYDDVPSEICHIKRETGNADYVISVAETDRKCIIVRTEFSTDSYSQSLLSDTKTVVWQEDGHIHIRASSMLSDAFRIIVASALGFDQESLIIHNSSIPSSRKLHAYKTAMLIIIAAKVSLATSSQVDLSYDLVSTQMQMKLLLESVVNTENGKIEAFRGKADANVGYYSLLPEESTNHLFAGLIPYFQTDNASVEVSVLKTRSLPTDFFGNTGFSVSSSAMGMHMLDIAKAIGILPDAWFKKNAGPCFDDFSEFIYSSPQQSPFTDTLSEVARKTDFSRKFSAYNQKIAPGNLLNPFIAYSGGIGISSGYGIRDFPSHFSITDKQNINSDKNDVQTNENGRMFETNPLFCVNSCGSIVTELHIDTVTLIPVIDNICISICFDAVSDTGYLKREIKRAVITTIADVCPGVNNTYDVDLSISFSKNGSGISSIDTVCAMTVTSFTDAVSQALRHRIKRIPLTVKDIVTILGEAGEDKNESHS